MPRKKIEKELTSKDIVDKELLRLQEVTISGETVYDVRLDARQSLVDIESSKARAALVQALQESYLKEREYLYENTTDPNFFKLMKLLELDAKVLVDLMVVKSTAIKAKR